MGSLKPTVDAGCVCLFRMGGGERRRSLGSLVWSREGLSSAGGREEWSMQLLY